MTSSFQLQHGAMLLRYSGISFISGAVNHGFFSEQRSLWTAAVGIVLFVLGAVLEHRLAQTHAQLPQNSLLQTLAWGSLLSIGLGFFTGGLQHFPDSPERSSWVVPLGFFVSVLALAFSAPRVWQRAATLYVIVLGALVGAGSWGAAQWLAQHPEWAATGHSHEQAGNENAAHDTAPSPLAALVVSRSIHLRMDDQMRFTPSTIQVLAGESVRFVVHNAGQTAHEMVLGSDEDIRQHAQAMQASTTQNSAHEAGHSHGSGAAITVAAGQTGELVVRFAQAQTLQMACLIPGHYDAGMRGVVNVVSALSAPSTTLAPMAPTAKPVHDHSSHKH